MSAYLTNGFISFDKNFFWLCRAKNTKFFLLTSYSWLNIDTLNIYAALLIL